VARETVGGGRFLGVSADRVADSGVMAAVSE